MQLNNAINSSGTKIKVNRALSLGYAALFYLAFSCVAHAGAPIAQVSSNLPLASPDVRDAPVTAPDKAGYADKVYWPMMPGESLEQLANTLYPDSPILKERFIKKTLSFSRALGDDVQPNEVFTSSKLLIIPNEKAVKELTHRIRKSEEVQQEEEALRMSYRLKASPVVAAVLPPISATTLASTSTVPPAQAHPAVTSAAAVTPTHDNTSLVTNSAPAKEVSVAPASSAPNLPVVSNSHASRPAASSPASSSSAFWDKLTMPTVRLPEIPWPKLEWPAISLPELHMPAWRLPDVNMPSMEWPAIDMPSMQVPDVAVPNLAWQPYWQATTQQLSAWYQHSVMAIQGAVRVTQQRTSSLLDDYQGKNATQVLHDYRLRNIALVSVLVMVFLVLWGLHIQRKRQQKKMLGMIESTITHRDAEFEIVIPAVALEESSSGVQSAVLQESLMEAPHHTLVTDAPALTQVYEQKNYH